jgi:hypothetical protein
MGHGEAFAAGSGHGCASGVGLKGPGVGEAGSVVADLGEDPGACEGSKSWQAGDDLGVRVLVKMVDGGGGQQSTRLGTQQAAAFVGEGVQQGWVVLPQQGAQLVVRAGARRGNSVRTISLIGPRR